MNRKFFSALLTSLVLTGAGYVLTPAIYAHETHQSMPGMKMKTKKANVVTVTPATSLVIDKTQNFTIKVQSDQGKAITQFDRVHEKLMHFIVVSNNLQSFQHLHPKYQGKGIFVVRTALPMQGAYTAFADYTPKGQSKQVGIVALDAGQGTSIAPTPDTNLVRNLDGIQITLVLDPKKIKLGKEMSITFKFQDPQGKPITNLQPYLGAMGHLVIIKYDPKLTSASYLHAHPQEMTDMAHMNHKMEAMSDMKMETAQNGTVIFESAFPTSGLYKMWGQFQREGKIITVDFTINIS
jgi:hypothetical protein